MSILVVDGSDCSFKETNVTALYERLLAEGVKVMKFHFPNYNSPSSALVKMYLGGEFGDNYADINPYVASLFYAVDRFGSYMTELKQFHDEGGLILLDRYVSSNMIHQAMKYQTEDEKSKFLEWLWDLEYVKIGIPVPDMTIFLDMPFQVASIINANRSNKITGGTGKDIHEKDPEFFKRSYQNALWVAKKLGWHTVSCVKGESFKEIVSGIPDNVKDRREIHEELYAIVTNFLKAKSGTPMAS